MDSPIKQNIAPLLEGFGLTEYESRAYITLLEKGSLTVGEIAYYSSIPRTKAYSTLRSLEKKGLVRINRSKPIRFYSLSPESCLKKFVDNEEIRLKKMKKAIAELKRIQEENKRPLLYEEANYLILGTSGIILKLRELIASCSISVKAIIDSWGLRILDQIKDSLIQAHSKGITIKLISLSPFYESESLTFIRGFIKIWKTDLGENLFLIDDDLLLAVNSNSGKGILIQSRELSSNLLSNLFLEMWKRAVDPEIYSQMVKLASNEERAWSFTQAKELKLLPKLLVEHLINSNSLKVFTLQFYKELTKQFGSESQTLNNLLTLVSKIIWENCEINYDEFNSIIKLSLNLKDLNFEQLYWLFFFIGYLLKEGFNLMVSKGEVQESLITFHFIKNTEKLEKQFF
ncbi:MAG: helix-turn-helix domain-containing protein [Nitrososphaerales archaeon]